MSDKDHVVDPDGGTLENFLDEIGIREEVYHSGWGGITRHGLLRYYTSQLGEFALAEKRVQNQYLLGRVFPARAGVNRQLAKAAEVSPGVPRARRGEPP